MAIGIVRSSNRSTVCRLACVSELVDVSSCSFSVIGMAAEWHMQTCQSAFYQACHEGAVRHCLDGHEPDMYIHICMYIHQ